LLATDELQEGFTTLWECGRLDLTVEALVVSDEFSSLFTADEVRRARQRLVDHHPGFFDSQPCAGSPVPLIWSVVRDLQGRSLVTLAQEKPFTVEAVTDSTVVVTPETRFRRPIARRDLERAWDHLVKTGSLTLTDIGGWSSAYAAAILAQAPGVAVETGPIRLRWRAP